MEIKLLLCKASNKGCNGFSFGVQCVEEGDRIPPLQGYGQALNRKLVSWVMTVVRLPTPGLAQ